MFSFFCLWRGPSLADVGAKTGTSQKVSKIQATGDTYLYIGSCITLAPIDDPEIAVFVMQIQTQQQMSFLCSKLKMQLQR